MMQCGGYDKRIRMQSEGELSLQIKQLEYLVKIVENGSISKAAEQLYITQPNLTKSISNLEKEYGIRLFNRKARGVELTAEGKEFMRYARKVIAAANALDSNFMMQKKEHRAELFLAAHQFDFIYDCLLKTYEKFENQSVHFSLIETDRSDVVQQVLDGNADIGFFVRNDADAKSMIWNKEAGRLEFHVLDQGNYYICVGPKSEFYDRESVGYGEVKDCLQLALDMEESAKQDLYFDNALLRDGGREKMIFFNTVSGCEHFLLNSDAVLFVSKWTVGCFGNPAIRTIPVSLESNLPTGGINELLMVKRAGEQLNETERVFLEIVRGRFASEKNELENGLVGA